MAKWQTTHLEREDRERLEQLDQQFGSNGYFNQIFHVKKSDTDRMTLIDNTRKMYSQIISDASMISGDSTYSCYYKNRVPAPCREYYFDVHFTTYDHRREVLMPTVKTTTVISAFLGLYVDPDLFRPVFADNLTQARKAFVLRLGERFSFKNKYEMYCN